MRVGMPKGGPTVGRPLGAISFRHTPTGPDVDALAVIAAMVTPPSAPRAAQIDTLVKALKAANVWALLDVLYITAAADTQAALLNWKAPGTFTASVVVAPTFVADRGYTGASGSWVTTNFNPATNGVNFVRDNASHWVFSRTAAASAFIDAGHGSGVSIICRALADTTNGVLNCISGGALANTDGSGFIGISRAASNLISYWRNGGLLGTSAQNSAAVASAVVNFCGNGNGSANIREQAAYAVGASLAGKELAFYNAMLAYMQGVGAA